MKFFGSSRKWIWLAIISLFLLVFFISFSGITFNHTTVDLQKFLFQDFNNSEWSENVIDVNYTMVGDTFMNETQTGYFPDVVIVGENRRKYTNQQSRKVAVLSREFQAKVKPDAKPKIIFLATPFHGMWSPDHYYALQFGRQSFEMYNCSYKNCLVTNQKNESSTADAVVFHLRDIKIDAFQLERNPNQKWILHTMEPPWLELNSLEHFEGVFNWTMSYRRDSDIVVRYGFIGKRLESLFVPGGKGQAVTFMNRKKAAVWLVSDCCTQSGRENYVRELKKYMTVDVFGGCGRDVCRPAETSACYENVVEGYLFYLSFENAICADYVTEKFFNILSYNVIPVVFGGAKYREIAPKHSFVDVADFSSPQDLAAYLNRLAYNETLFQTYFKWKRKYAAYMSPWTCELCKKLHRDLTKRTVKNNLKKWYVDDAECQAWTKDGYVKKPAPIFPCYQKKIF